MERAVSRLGLTGSGFCELPKGEADAATREQLYNDARKLGVEGRSKMNKKELQRAVAGAS